MPTTPAPRLRPAGPPVSRRPSPASLSAVTASRGPRSGTGSAAASEVFGPNQRSEIAAVRPGVSGLRRVSFTHPRSRVSPWRGPMPTQSLEILEGEIPSFCRSAAFRSSPMSFGPCCVSAGRQPKDYSDGYEGFEPHERPAASARMEITGWPRRQSVVLKATLSRGRFCNRGRRRFPTAVHCATVPGWRPVRFGSWRRLGIANRIPWSEPSRLTLGQSPGKIVGRRIASRRAQSGRTRLDRSLTSGAAQFSAATALTCGATAARSAPLRTAIGCRRPLGIPPEAAAIAPSAPRVQIA